MAKPEAAKNLISYALIGKVSGVTGCIEKDPTMVNSRSTKRGFSPLQVAASAEQNAAETMQVLLAAGADPKHQDMMAMTVLHVAAAKPNPEAFLKVMSLPDAKALIDMVDEDGCTALHYAASEGRLEIVEALMRAGAATAPENSSGQTPLALAKEGAFDAVISLLENGLPPEPGAEGAEGGGEEEES